LSEAETIGANGEVKKKEEVVEKADDGNEGEEAA
jgi:hypothetical protein